MDRFPQVFDVPEAEIAVAVTTDERLPVQGPADTALRSRVPAALSAIKLYESFQMHDDPNEQGLQISRA